MRNDVEVDARLRVGTGVILSDFLFPNLTFIHSLFLFSLILFFSLQVRVSLFSLNECATGS